MMNAPLNPAPRTVRHLRTAAAAGGLVALLILVSLARPAGAQDGPGSFERVDEYIQQTEQILMRAAEAVEESESARARLVLQEAKGLHDRSVRLLMDGRRLLAFELSQRARRAAQHAARMARDELGFEERVRLRLERLREMHEQVLDRAQETHNERVMRFVREAERQYQQAREQYAQRNYEIAFHLLESAESLLHKAARLLFEGGGAQSLRHELQRTADFIDRMRERVAEAGNAEAAQLLDRAEQMVQKAREALGRGEPLHALHLARQARRLAGQAAGMIGGGPPVEAIQEQIQRWDDWHEVVSENVRGSGSDAARTMLERAVRHRRNAEEALRAGDREDALRQIKIAHDLLNEAGELIR